MRALRAADAGRAAALAADEAAALPAAPNPRPAPRRLLFLLGGTLASLVFGSWLGWGTPDDDIIASVFGGRAHLEQLLPHLSASKDLVEYAPNAKGVPPLASPVMPVGQRDVSAHVLLQMRGYLLKTRTFDESKTLNALASLKSGDIGSNAFLYGGAHLATVGLAMGAAHSLGLTTMAPDRSRYLTDPAAMKVLYVAARLVSVVSAVVLAILVVAALRNFGGALPAVMAVAFLCASAEMQAAAHIAKPHTLAAAAAFASMLLVSRDDGRRLIFAGMLAGIAAGASIVYGAVVAVLTVSVLGRHGTRRALLFLGTAIATFVATNPHVLLAPRALLGAVTNHNVAYGYGGVSPIALVRFIEQLGTLGIGWAGIAFALAGSFLAWRRARAWIVYFWALLLVFGAGIGELRIGLIVVPLGAVVAALGVKETFLRVRPRVLRAGIVALALALEMPAIANAAALSYAFAVESDPATSPSRKAGRWINDMIPPGATVAIQDSSSWTDDVPPFEFLKFRTTGDAADADYVVLSGKCGGDIAAEVERMGLSRLAVEQKFSHCATLPAFLCNCRFQVALNVWVLRDRERAP